MKYDYLIVGAGLTGAVFAQQIIKKNKTVLIIDKNNHIGGNCYSEKVEGIEIHKYGPHIFHTNEKKIWEYINQFGEFNNFINRPKIKYNNLVYSFPINLMTMNQLWGELSPKEAKEKIDKIKLSFSEIKDIEQFCLANIGEELYEIFIKGYTTKQWGKSPKELPLNIIKRIPIRFDYNDNYYNDKFQGIPIKGYAHLIKNMIKGAAVKYNVDYFKNKKYWDNKAKNIIYTGKIDEFFNYQFGELEYRSLDFQTVIINEESYQGNAVINYTDEHIKYTRIIEHKYFNYKKNAKTVITKEFPKKYDKETTTPYYPINDKKNNNLYFKYKALAKKNKNVIFAGRLGKYLYLDMDKAIKKVLNKMKKID